MNVIQEHFKQAIRANIGFYGTRGSGLLSKRDLISFVISTGINMDIEIKLKILNQVIKEEKKKGLLKQSGLGDNAIFQFQMQKYKEMQDNQMQTNQQNIMVTLENYIIKKKRLTAKELVKFASTIKNVGGFNGAMHLSSMVVRNAKNQGYIYVEGSGKDAVIHVRG